MIRCLIVDDKPLAIDILKDYISRKYLFLNWYIQHKILWMRLNMYIRIMLISYFWIFKCRN